MKLKSFILSFSLLVLMLPSSAQNHLDYSYTLDAISYSIPGYDQESFYFKAHLYPVFNSHLNDSLKRKINAIFQEELILPKSAELKERLVGVKIDNFMSDEMVLDMLKARIGLLNTKAEELEYTLQVRTDRIDYPDNRAPYFNYYLKNDLDGSGADLTVEEHRVAYDWAAVTPLKLGDLGSKKLIKCTKEKIEASTLKTDGCDESLIKQSWIDAIDCETIIAKLEKDYVMISAQSRDFECSTSAENHLLNILIQRSCFENDKLCDE